MACCRITFPIQVPDNSHPFHGVGKGNQEAVATYWPHKLDLGNWRSVLVPVLGMHTQLAFPILEAAQGHSLKIVT